MAKIYHVSGKPLDIIKREAKELAAQSGAPLRGAQNILAGHYGQDTWQELMESTVELDESAGLNGAFLFKRYAGDDEMVFDFTALEEMFTGGSFDEEEMPALFVHKSLEQLSDNGVSKRIEVVGFDQNSRNGGDLKYFLQLKSGKGIDDYLEAIFHASEGKPSMMIDLMNQDGVFDIDPMVNILNFEEEALQILDLRKGNTAVSAPEM